MGILSAFRFAFQNLFFSPILYGVIASLAVFSTVWESGDRLKDQLTDRQRSQDDTFDFIIVGGGSAGAVLANRLSQFHTVLLLEAGGETHPFQAIPGLAIFIPKNPGTDYMHKSVTQTKSCLSCPHKKYILSQGKNLGGTGNLNYMVHLRGNPLDFDNWATITGDPSWGYEGVLPYFIQSENYVGKTTDDQAHGKGGPLHIEIPDYIGLANEWNAAGLEMGYSHVDLNGRHSEGFDTAHYPIKRGLRQATYRSYIQPVRKRLSLVIRKFAHVNKVLIRDGTNDAYGVEYDRHGHRKHAFANREVILSAGTLQTPKLLVLSGVGQLEHLNALHIPVRSVLPVGKNLQDHFSTLLGPFYINKHRTISFDRDVDKQSFVRFAINGKGPLSTTGFMATAVVSSAIAKAEGQGGWPDIQLTLFGLTPHRMFYSDIGHAFGIREDILHRYYGDVEGKENAFFIMVTLARPLSKGDYCLPSKNPYKAPQIDPNSLMDELGHDAQVMIEGIHRALYIAENTTAFQGLGTVYSKKCFPGCDGVQFRSDAYWECYIRHFSIANNDHVGTCPMGKLGSPYAVVDPQLKVMGVKRLRVVDASVMPTIVGAPTQAATIMIGEKASALIMDEWKHEAKEFYGPPGLNPGTPVAHYGPPHGNSISSQYGPPPSPGPGPQYGPPGLKPAPVAGGDGFENYDSFSVIRDQFNPNGGGGGGTVTPTALIPINPNNQLWSTPAPFPNTAVNIPPAFISGVSPGPPPLLGTPEPSVVLLPPEDSLNAPSPTFASSYSTSNLDFGGGSIVSTTPGYSVSYHLDTSRSEKTSVISEADDSNNNNNNNGTGGSRQGKSFGEPSSTISSLPEGNQLGQGLDDEVLQVSSPPPTQVYYSTPVSTATTLQGLLGDVTETEVLTEGPGFKVVRKRIRTTPRVVVHPRGHLGHQNVPRKATAALNESLESLFLTTSSHRPVPKDIVKIRRRRPGKTGQRKRLTTTTPDPTTDITYITAYSNNEAVQLQTPSTTSRPITRTTTVLPSELKSPGKKRFVRRMFFRPLNYNRKRRGGARGQQNEFIATTTAPITVAYDDGTTGFPQIVERIDLDTAATSSIEHVKQELPTTVEPLLSSEIDAEYTSYEDGVTNGNETGTTVSTKNTNNSTSAAPPPQPVIIFKNIELEDVQQLNRQTRGVNQSDYFNLEAAESRNPIMPVDLNPFPQILAPRTVAEWDSKDNSTHEIVAVNLKNQKIPSGKGGDYDDDDQASVSDGTNSSQDSYDEGYGYADEDYDDEVTQKPVEEDAVYFDEDYEDSNNSSSVNSFEEGEGNENSSFISSSSNSNRSSSSSLSSISGSARDGRPVEIVSIRSNENLTPTSTSSSSSIKNEDVRFSTTKRSRPSSSSSSSSSSRKSPGYMFRARNKLLRTFS